MTPKTIVTILKAAVEPAPNDLETLHAKLEQDADAQQILDVAYRLIDTPIGPLLLAATPRGLVRVAFALEGFEAVVQQLADTISSRILKAPHRLDAAARQFEEYFTGKLTHFSMPLDLQLSRGFRRTVLEHLPMVEYGRTRTYTQLAAMVGNPRAVRAVGTACATNPLPLVIPCHRVVRTDGGMGGYLGGVNVKQRLLRWEREHAPEKAAVAI